ncbi:CZB domain-containing protein [Adhaeribacter swui]|uniref:CZB domain-containing protein n=1 Tax=Adhaeribacter swui TaxID=2086471 RepID=A0A7G7GEV3_9BACT|nr:CZB domain-containing protein [Adhaeribacter swui]QNF35687.1 CZB domain-containing protein [Adhaeribacter swui]
MQYLDHEFKAAITKHFLFKSKVKSYVYGVDTALAPILDHRQCNFGIWIKDYGFPLYGHIPAMLQLNKVHEEIHEYATYLVNLKKSGKDEEAINGLAGLEERADQIIQLLHTIQAESQS